MCIFLVIAKSSQSLYKSQIIRVGEWKFHVIFALGSESSRGRKFQGTKVPWSESTREQKFHLWNFRSRERKYVGTKVP